MQRPFFRTFVLITLAWLALAFPWQWRNAAAAGNEPRTDLDVFALNANRTMQGKISSLHWQSGGYTGIPGFNLVRSFQNAQGQTFLFALNGNKGLMKVFALNNDGQISSTLVTGIITDSDLRCTNAEIVRVDGKLRLITQDSFTGKVRLFPIGEDGKPVLDAPETLSLPEMRDKNLFSVYETTYSVRFIGADTWSGDTATYLSDGQKLGTPNDQWTRGWTSLDHVKIGSVNYRLLYKAAGDPYKKADESGDQTRRLLLEKVLANGETQTVEDTTLPVELGDVSSARFIRFAPNSSGTNTGILFFKRTTSEYAVYAFSGSGGLGAQLDAGKLRDSLQSNAQAAIAPPYIDLTTFFINGKACFAGVNADNAKPLSYEQAENMGRIMHNPLKTEVVGYQFILAQSGRIYFSRAYGKLKLTHSAAQDEEMTTRSQLELGSVSKVVTAVTVLKLEERDQISLNDKVGTRLKPGLADNDSWVHKTPIRNLLAHTTGISKEVPAQCDADDSTLKMDCQAFFDATPDSDPPCANDANGNRNCNRAYNNSNTRVARKVIEKVTGVETATGIMQKTHQLWAEKAGLNGMVCQANPEAYYYGPCAGADDCFDYAGKSWRRARALTEMNYTPLCSSGGWYASSREMIEFMSAIRYGRLLDGEANAKLLDTQLMDVNGGATALGWDSPFTLDGEACLSKGGHAVRNGIGVKAHITRLPNNCDAVIQFNTETDFSGSGILRDAYKAVVLGQTVLGENGVYAAFPSLEVRNAVINSGLKGTTENTHVVVTREGNHLRLQGFRASHVWGKATLQRVDESSLASLESVMPTATKNDMAVTDGRDFVTASAGIGNQLFVIAWRFENNQLQRHAVNFRPYEVKEVAATKVSVVNGVTRVVTAVRTNTNVLRLDVWDINNQANTLSHRDTRTGPTVEAIELKGLGKYGDVDDPGRFVLAFRNESGYLEIRTYEVTLNGEIHLLHTQDDTTETVSNDEALPHRVGLDAKGDGVSKFFGAYGFLTTAIMNSGKLKMTTWQVDASGAMTKRDDISTGGAVIDHTVSATNTIVMLPAETAAETGKIKVIKWHVSDNGSLTRGHEFSHESRFKRLAAAGNLVGAFVLPDPTNVLYVINWTQLEP